MKVCPLCQKTYNMEILTECTTCKTPLIRKGDKRALQKFQEELKKNIYELEVQMGLHENKNTSFKGYYIWGGLTSLLIVIAGLLRVYL